MAEAPVPYVTQAILMPLDELAHYETVIERGKQTFVDVGTALLAIRDGRGYRTAGFPTFEAYCMKRWGWGRTNAYRYIEAAEAVRNVPTSEHSPNLSQAVELARLPAAAQREVAEEVDWNTTPVREVRRIVNERLGNPQAEQEIAESIFELAGDPNGKVANSRIRFAFADAKYATRSKLIPLDAQSVAETVAPEEINAERWFIRDLRGWLDEFERALGRGLRVVEAE